VGEPELPAVVVRVLPKGTGKRIEYRINLWSEWAKRQYGHKVFRIGISLNTPCPNRDKGGCIFCLQDSFAPEFRELEIKEQLRLSMLKLKQSTRDNIGFVAYFQDETMGAISPENLDYAIAQAMNYPGIEGVIVSTRPDHCNRTFLEIIKRHNAFLELGVQTIHAKSLAYLNRNHTHEDTMNAFRLIKEFQLSVGVHLIIGIPGESRDDLLRTIDFVNDHSVITDVKLHNLVAFRNTVLADSGVKLPDIDEYIDTLLFLLPHINVETTISRLFTSNIMRNETALNIQGEKKKWLNKFLKRIYEEDITQGSFLF
jgi:radical SAM protein (TIGR01212 family)